MATPGVVRDVDGRVKSLEEVFGEQLKANTLTEVFLDGGGTPFLVPQMIIDTIPVTDQSRRWNESDSRPGVEMSEGPETVVAAILRWTMFRKLPDPMDADYPYMACCLWQTAEHYGHKDFQDAIALQYIDALRPQCTVLMKPYDFSAVTYCLQQARNPLRKFITEHIVFRLHRGEDVGEMVMYLDEAPGALTLFWEAKTNLDKDPEYFDSYMSPARVGNRPHWRDYMVGGGPDMHPSIAKILKEVEAGNDQRPASLAAGIADQRTRGTAFAATPSTHASDGRSSSIPSPTLLEAW